MSTRSIAALLTASAATLLPGCSGDQAHDSWWQGRPIEQISNDRWHEIPSEYVHEVKGEAASTAISLLGNQAYYKLVRDEFRAFTGKDVSFVGGREFFLLRALRTKRGNGLAVVLSDGSAVTTTYYSLAKNQEIMKAPIVAELPDVPLQVYVEIATAE